MTFDILSLFRQLVEIQKINFTVLDWPYVGVETFDMGLRKMFFSDYSFQALLDFLESFNDDPILYHFIDSYECHYYFIKFMNKSTKASNGQTSYIIIGPYLTEEISPEQVNTTLERLSLPISLEKELTEYYNAVPIIQETARFNSMLSTLASQVLDNPPDFTVVFLGKYHESRSEQVEYHSDNTPVIMAKMIEDRYKAENKILIYLEQGNEEKAQIALYNFLQFHIAPRFKDPIRNIKNLTIVLNTLCRKAVENSNVHPIHIDEISRDFAIRIESITSLKEADSLQKLMIRKYCMLVTNYSLTGFSPIIQGVINHIEMNISEPMSLSQISDLFSINASYLSSLFKKEMGITITNFINQQKVRFAIMLLNKTDTQIQDIASQVGIHDVNYFIKVFKKIIGMTPKEYRNSIKGQKDL